MTQLPVHNRIVQVYGPGAIELHGGFQMGGIQGHGTIVGHVIVAAVSQKQIAVAEIVGAVGGAVQNIVRSGYRCLIGGIRGLGQLGIEDGIRRMGGAGVFRSAVLR